MRSLIYRGTTTHERLKPVRHSFRYRIYWLGIDLEEIDQIDRSVRGFGYNRWSLASVRDHDYGGPGDGRIRDRVLALLKSNGIDGSGMQIMLMTIPRILGYVFNPVNFYVCMDKEGQVQALLAEVRNTFGEMHHYAAAAEQVVGPGEFSTFQFAKRFYVSPFLEIKGTYFVRVQCEEDAFSASIALEQDGDRIFIASMEGLGVPLTSRSMLTTMLRLPISAGSIMLKIQWQAILLRLRRGIRPKRKPEPSDSATIRAPRSSVWYWLRDRFLRYASKPQKGMQGESTVEEERTS